MTAIAPRNATRNATPARKRAPVLSVRLTDVAPFKAEVPTRDVTLTGADALERASATLRAWRENGVLDATFKVVWTNGHVWEGWKAIPRASNRKADAPDLGSLLFNAACDWAEGAFEGITPGSTKEGKTLLATLAFCAEEAGR